MVGRFGEVVTANAAIAREVVAGVTVDPTRYGPLTYALVGLMMGIGSSASGAARIGVLALRALCSYAPPVVGEALAHIGDCMLTGKCMHCAGPRTPVPGDAGLYMCPDCTEAQLTPLTDALAERPFLTRATVPLILESGIPCTFAATLAVIDAAGPAGMVADPFPACLVPLLQADADLAALVLAAEPRLTPPPLATPAARGGRRAASPTVAAVTAAAAAPGTPAPAEDFRSAVDRVLPDDAAWPTERLAIIAAHAAFAGTPVGRSIEADVRMLTAPPPPSGKAKDARRSEHAAKSARARLASYAARFRRLETDIGRISPAVAIAFEQAEALRLPESKLRELARLIRQYMTARSGDAGEPVPAAAAAALARLAEYGAAIDDIARRAMLVDATGRVGTFVSMLNAVDIGDRRVKAPAPPPTPTPQPVPAPAEPDRMC